VVALVVVAVPVAAQVALVHQDKEMLAVQVLLVALMGLAAEVAQVPLVLMVLPVLAAQGVRVLLQQLQALQ
jgi:hypothetical protein